MKNYNKLSFSGKLRRLHGLASAALSQYDLDDPVMTYFGFDTNLLYRVVSASGEKFMLRLASPGWRTLIDLQSEALWLEALDRDTDIPVPRIIPTRIGEFVQQISAPGIPHVRNLSLMKWIPGRLLGHYLTPKNIEKMGILFAILHQHGAQWVPPDGFTTRCFEHWLSRGEPNLLIQAGDANNALQKVAKVTALPADMLNLLQRMHQHVESAYAMLDRSDLRVIHCDLWHDNIKLHNHVLSPIDFEDTTWGFRAHDIAMGMLDLLEAVGEHRYPEMLGVFKRGYQTQLAWPDDPIEPFQIGRLLWKINWVANHQPQELMTMVENHIPVFECYQQAGKLTLPVKKQQ